MIKPFNGRMSPQLKTTITIVTETESEARNMFIKLHDAHRDDVRNYVTTGRWQLETEEAIMDIVPIRVLYLYSMPKKTDVLINHSSADLRIHRGRVMNIPKISAETKPESDIHVFT